MTITTPNHLRSTTVGIAVLIAFVFCIYVVYEIHTTAAAAKLARKKELFLPKSAFMQNRKQHILCLRALKQKQEAFFL